MPTRVLLVEDDSAVVEGVRPFLELSGFEVTVARDGREGLAQIERDPPDIVVMDVLMPHMNGREALRTLRQANNWIPVILLTQVVDEANRIVALNEGADDYLNKPFSLGELVARIGAVLRRTRPNTPPLSAAEKLFCAHFHLKRKSRKIIKNTDGSEISVTPKAYDLLEYMMTHADELLTRERLLDAVWDDLYPGWTRTIDVRIGELRKALDDDARSPRLIETVAGKGYLFIGEVKRE